MTPSPSSRKIPRREAGVAGDWELTPLAHGLGLLAYVIRRASRDSRHSSIWTIRGGDLQIVFHQGTFVDAAVS